MRVSESATKCQTTRNASPRLVVPYVPGSRFDSSAVEPPGRYGLPPSATDARSIDSPARSGTSR